MPCHTPPNTVHAETQAKWAAGRGEKAGAPGGEWLRVWAVPPVRETVAGSTAQRRSSCGGRGGLPHPCPEYGALRHGTRTAILLTKAGSPAGARDAKERDRRGMI